MIQTMRLAVFASGGGSNFQALIDAIETGRMPHATLALLVASKDEIGAIERAKSHGIPHVVLSKRQFESGAHYDSALLSALKDAHIGGLVLAGYLGILSKAVVEAFPKRILNIHPALIPSFCGKGFYGMHVHEAVVASGCKVSGATVHFVDADIDTGAILLQESVPVFEDDTAKTLQERVLKVEHKLLPIAVEALAAGAVDWVENRAFLRRRT